MERLCVLAILVTIKFRDEVLLRVLCVEGADQDAHDREEDALEAADVREHIEDRVASPLHQLQVHVHLDLKTLNKIFVLEVWDLTNGGEGENTGVLQLRDLVEVDCKVL